MPPGERIPALSSAGDVLPTLSSTPIEVVGRVLDASNIAFLAALAGDAEAAHHVIYKPVAGERPLWDFPDGHLAYREVATYLVAAAGGWDCVPPTVLRNGPAGPGSVQLWVTPVPPEAQQVDIEDDTPVEPDAVDPDELEALEEEAEVGLLSDEADPDYVGLFAPDAVGPSWLPVLSGQLGDGRPVVVAHRDAPELRSVAVLDAVLNNSDRKGSHLLVAPDGHLWGIDHGLTFHAEDKLRTVLWGWAGQEIPAIDRARLDRLAALLAGPEDSGLLETLHELLTVAEVTALRHRVARLARTGRHPHPPDGWPAVPWPPL